MNQNWRSVALVMLGAFATLAGQQILGGADAEGDALGDIAGPPDAQIEELSALAERRAQTTQELALSQFYRLQEFRQFGAEGQGVVYLVPISGAGDEDPVSASAAGGAVRLPRLAVDPGARDLWDGAAQRLGSLGGSVDPRIFDTFEAVRAFAAEHPWPTGTGLAAARRSDWTRPDVIEAWLTLNRALVSRVDGLLAGF